MEHSKIIKFNFSSKTNLFNNKFTAVESKNITASGVTFIVNPLITFMAPRLAQLDFIPQHVNLRYLWAERLVNGYFPS